MAKGKDLLKSDVVGDLEAQLNRDFNNVIKEIHKSLGTKKHSPVRTGFLASSWKVQNSPIQATDDILKFNPWAQMKRAESAAFFRKDTTFKHKPKIQPRFAIKRTFNIKKSVFIGNKVKYASYALEGGKIQNFVQGRMREIIKKNMKEKKGKLFLLGKGTTGGFGSLKSGVGYGDVL